MPRDRLRAPCLCLVPTMIARPPVDEFQRSCFSCSNRALLHGPPRWPFDPASLPSVYAKIGLNGVSHDEAERRRWGDYPHVRSAWLLKSNGAAM